MKIMSKDSCATCHGYLLRAQDSINICLGKMRGKYGTSEAASRLEAALIYINHCISDDYYKREFFQQFRNPPNTPKSRRLGWHKKVEKKVLAKEESEVQS